MWLTSFIAFVFLTSIFIVPLLLLPVAIAVFMIPTLVAFQRGHKQRTAILALNLLLGWSFVFWAIALIWALKK